MGEISTREAHVHGLHPEGGSGIDVARAPGMSWRRDLRNSVLLEEVFPQQTGNNSEFSTSQLRGAAEGNKNSSSAAKRKQYFGRRN